VLTDFYRRLLASCPGIGPIAAVKAGMDHFGRGFGSPDLADHRAALKAARDEAGAE
jgi:hypothetical protein